MLKSTSSSRLTCCQTVFLTFLPPSVSDCSVYIVHDEVKDKAFELELSWVGEGENGPIRALLLFFFPCCFICPSIFFYFLCRQKSVKSLV